MNVNERKEGNWEGGGGHTSWALCALPASAEMIETPVAWLAVSCLTFSGFWKSLLDPSLRQVAEFCWRAILH